MCGGVFLPKFCQNVKKLIWCSSVGGSSGGVGEVCEPLAAAVVVLERFVNPQSIHKPKARPR